MTGRPTKEGGVMRMLLKVQMDVEAGTRAIRDGSWRQVMERMM